MITCYSGSRKDEKFIKNNNFKLIQMLAKRKIRENILKTKQVG